MKLVQGYIRSRLNWLSYFLGSYPKNYIVSLDLEKLILELYRGLQATNNYGLSYGKDYLYE